MTLDRVHIGSLRCLEEVSAELSATHNYLYGLNGAGKTSFLEALYLLSRGRSFRTRQSKRLIQRNAEALLVYGEVSESGERQHRIGVRLDKTGRTISLDRESVASAVTLAEVMRTDVIDPSIHGLVEGGPSDRRRFMDWGVFHVEHSFLEAWRRYRRALGQRNAALKNRGANRVTLRFWDAELIEAGEFVTRARTNYVDGLRPVVDSLSRQLLGAPVVVEYRNGWRSGEELQDALVRSRQRDEHLGSTQVGPHRADFRLELDGWPVSGLASRGQQKLVAAALAVAQVQFVRGHELGGEGKTEILLIDDPAAELDRQALDRLLAVVADTGIQTVFTALSREQLPPEQGAAVFHVEQGRVEQMV